MQCFLWVDWKLVGWQREECLVDYVTGYTQSRSKDNKEVEGIKLNKGREGQGWGKQADMVGNCVVLFVWGGELLPSTFVPNFRHFHFGFKSQNPVSLLIVYYSSLTGRHASIPRTGQNQCGVLMVPPSLESGKGGKRLTSFHALYSYWCLRSHQ